MYLFYTSVLFLDGALSAGRISANPMKWKCEELANPQYPKGVYTFLILASYYHRVIAKFAQMAGCLQELVFPTSNWIKKQVKVK